MKLDLSPFNLASNLPGQRPRAPIAVRVTLGRQPPDRLGQAFPIAKDRLWLCSPIADGEKVRGRNGEYTQKFLPLHPDFARFNHDPFLAIEQWDDRKFGALLGAVANDQPTPNPPAELDMIKGALNAIPKQYQPGWRAAMETHRKTRRIIRGVIVHRNFLSSPPSSDDAGWLRFAANGAKTVRGESLIPHPQKLPACTSSDGKTAHRWNGTRYVERDCLGERCPFREHGSASMGDGQACGKTITLVFQIRWPDLCWRCSGLSSSCPECKGTGAAPPMPSAYAEIECSGGFNFAAKAIADFFADVQTQWLALDLPGDPDFIGLPFLLQMQHKTGEGKAYWTAHMSYDFPAGQTFQSWAFARAQMRHVGKALMVGSTPLIEDGETPRESYVRTRLPLAAVPGEVLDG